MLTMAEINYIKHLRQVEGKSIEEIARILGISWRTAKKYADAEVLEWRGLRPRQRRNRPVLGSFVDVIDIWLEEDPRMPAKQRNTARQIYKRLKEIGYEGSERTVSGYVREMKAHLAAEREERYVRLEHSPGEAQVDFGEFKALDTRSEGERVSHAFLVMSFPYSNAQAARIVPSTNAQCFMEGLKWIFEEIGGVPREIWFDNMSPAVKKVLSGGNRELTEAFERFKWHYRFAARFCTPSRANEQGSVENKVGYVRRGFLTPVPIVNDIEEANRELARRLAEDMDREHYRKGKSIKELWKEDRAALLQMPVKECEVFKSVAALVNRVGEVMVDGAEYHVPWSMHGNRVFLKVYWDRIEVYDLYGEKKLGVMPRKYSYSAERVDWGAELKVFVNKPRAVEYATHVKALPAAIKEFIVEADVKERRDRIKTLVTLFEAGYGLKEVEKAVETGLGYGVADASSLRLVADRNRSGGPRALPELYTPDEVRNWKPDLDRYSLLCQVTGND
jgi:transposase